mgnify:CR=1 FL=1
MPRARLTALDEAKKSLPAQHAPAKQLTQNSRMQLYASVLLRSQGESARFWAPSARAAARRSLEEELESRNVERLDHAKAAGIDVDTLERGTGKLKELKMAEELHQAMRKLPAGEVNTILDRMVGRGGPSWNVLADCPGSISSSYGGPQAEEARAHALQPREPGFGYTHRRDGSIVLRHKGMAARLSEREHPPSWPGEPFARELLTRVLNPEQADGKTALQVAASIGEWRGTDQSRSRELCERLIALGASPSTKAATCAARAGRPALKRHLLALHQQRRGSAAPLSRSPRRGGRRRRRG